MQSEDIAQQACEELDKEQFGGRTAWLNPMSYKQFESFMEDQLGCKTVSIANILNEENVHQYVKLRGMPRDVTEDQVKEFFGDFELEDDAITIEMR